jgi:mannose-1-phosphate guanylyltransferase
MESALGHLDNKVEEINLLGIRPERADPDLGYIIPGLADGPGVSRVDRFIEKPSELLARHLVDAGGLWNAFILTARIGTLLNLFASRHPHIVATMQSAIGHDGDRIDDAKCDVRNLSGVARDRFFTTPTRWRRDVSRSLDGGPLWVE